MIQKSDIPASALKYSQREKIIAFSENNRVYTAENDTKKQVLGFRVDGGLITATDIRKCDFSLVVESDVCYLIELKGAGIEEACEQLSKTIDYFSTNYQMQKFVGRIVISRYNSHKIHSEKYVALERKLRLIQKKYGIGKAPLMIKAKLLSEKI